jgi:anti-sigma factor RsiW
MGLEMKMGRLFGRRESERERRDELLSAYLDDELSTEEQARLEAQLATDPALRAELDALRHTVTLVRDLPPVPLPRNFVLPQTMAVLPRPTPSVRPRRGWTAPLLTAATAVVSLMFVVVLVGDLLLSGTGGLPAAPMAEPAMERAIEVEAPAEAPQAALAPSPIVEAEEVAAEAVEAEVVVEVTVVVEAEEDLSLDTMPTDTPLSQPAEAPLPAEPAATDEGEDYVVEAPREGEVTPTASALGVGGPAVEPIPATPTPAPSPAAELAPATSTLIPSPVVVEQAEDTPTVLLTPVAPGADESIPEPPPDATAGVVPSPQALWSEEGTQRRAPISPWRILEIALGLATLGLALTTVRAWRTRRR